MIEFIEGLGMIVQVGFIAQNPWAWLGTTLFQLVAGVVFIPIGRFLIGRATADLPGWMAWAYGVGWTVVTIVGVILAYHCELYYNPGYRDPFYTGVWLALVFGFFVLHGVDDARKEVDAMSAKDKPEALTEYEMVVRRNRAELIACIYGALWLLGYHWGRRIPFFGITVGAVLMIVVGRPHTAQIGIGILILQAIIVWFYVVAKLYHDDTIKMCRRASLELY